ncbi:MAG TPA: hypothetical protein VME44_11520 [Streptosporangiaceae bacterium]|nr:hypothetical protein [Streptosporangiaceae bacterium]
MQLKIPLPKVAAAMSAVAGELARGYHRDARLLCGSLAACLADSSGVVTTTR